MKMIPQGDTDAVRERIFNKSIPMTESGCWIWTGSVHPSGYCRTSVGNVTRLAHRVSFEAFHGEIPDGMLVCHRCDNRLCVNPEHLFIGDHSANNSDMFKKGRHRVASGTMSGGAKLNDQKVRQILALKGVMPQREIAAIFGVTQPTISDIHRGVAWLSCRRGYGSS